MGDHEPKSGRNLVKINDLPLYPENKPSAAAASNAEGQKTNDLEESVRHARRTVVENLSFLGDAFEVSKGYYHHGVGKSKQLYESLTDEKEQTTKIIAIASGGLLGMTLSLRKGLFKKLLYTGLFSGSVAAFCYPKYAKEYADIVSYIAKNKVPPVVKEYTGVDLNEQVKNFNDSLPDLSSLKNLWGDRKEADKSSEKPSEKPSEPSKTGEKKN